MENHVENIKELPYWLALSRIPGFGMQKYLLAKAQFPCLKELFNATPTTWRALGYSEELISALQAPPWSKVEQDLKWLQGAPDRHVLVHTDERYPPLLRVLDSGAPLLLYVIGNPHLLIQPQLAMVGSRNPTRGGEEIAYEFAHALAQAGLTITSGMALGIDAASHRGALAAKMGSTIGVLGTGVDRIYPNKNKELAEEVAAKGALLSEFPLGTAANAEHFPQRNRIVSGLSLGTLVVEAALRSGSIITARLAGEQGREVFAIPGSIRNPIAKGCHSLIKQGVKLVETVQDILLELAPQLAHQLEQVTPTASKASLPGLAEDYQMLLQCIEFEPVAIDELVARSGFSASQVATMLLILELKGHVTNSIHGYLRVR